MANELACLLLAACRRRWSVGAQEAHAAGQAAGQRLGQ